MHLTAIKTKNLTFSFHKYPVLHNINLNVPSGCIFGFLGPNGAGKTTTIKALLGLLKVPNDSVFIYGEDINKHHIPILKKTGAMVEDPSLYEQLTALENLQITCKLRNIPQKRISEVLKIVKLSNDAKRKVNQYSTGMKQRLSVAIALLSEPELLMLDEPINGLDPQGIIEIRNLLQELSQTKKTTIFLSSHILSEIEKLCTHVGIIRKGELVFQGTMDELANIHEHSNRVKIETSDNTLATSLLASQFLVKTEEKHLILYYSDKKEITKAMEILIANGIFVYAVFPINETLETSFLSLLNE